MANIFVGRVTIDKVPDFFVSGHIHRCTVAKYNNITLLNCSCWFPQSDYQEKRGIIPEPSKAVVVNLQTRDVKVMDFSEISSEEEIKEDIKEKILHAPQKILDKITGKENESK